MIYNIIGIALAIVVVGSILLIFAYKRNILNIRSLFKSRRKKTFPNKIMAIKILFNNLGGVNNIIKVNQDQTKIYLKLNKDISIGNQLNQSELRIYKESVKTYFIKFDNELITKEIYETIILSMQ